MPTQFLTNPRAGTTISFASYNPTTNNLTVQTSSAYGDTDTAGICESFIAATRPGLVVFGQRLLSNRNMFEVLTRDVGLEEEEDNINIADIAAAAAAAADGGGEDAAANANVGQKTIPFKVLKSSSFDIKACRLMILEKLHVQDNQGRAPTSDQFVANLPQASPAGHRNPYADSSFPSAPNAPNTFNQLSGYVGRASEAVRTK